MKKSGLLLPASALWLLAGCVSVSTAPLRPLAPTASPVFPAVTLVGPLFRDVRAAGTDVVTTGTVGSSIGSYSGGAGGTFFGTGTSTSTTSVDRYEAFDNPALAKLFRRLVEDNRIAERVTGGAPWRLESSIHQEATTGAGKVTWNVVNTVTLLFLLASPYLGTSEVTLEVRAYHDDRYLRTYAASATADWRVPGLWGLAWSLGEAKRRALFEAGQVALFDVVRAIAADPPRIPKPAEPAP